MNIQQLENFIAANPGMADVPLYNTRIGMLSPRQALAALRAGQITEGEL